MSRRAWSTIVLLSAVAALLAGAALGAAPTPATDGAPKAPATKAPAAKASAAKSPAPKETAGSAAKTSAAKTPSAKESASRKAATSTAKAAPRRLQDIHIEGEIPVPQVLFITARDQRRFMDFQHRRYLRTSRELGEATAFPTRIVVTGTGGNDDRKEISR